MPGVSDNKKIAADCTETKIERIKYNTRELVSFTDPSIPMEMTEIELEKLFAKIRLTLIANWTINKVVVVITNVLINKLGKNKQTLMQTIDSFSACFKHSFTARYSMDVDTPVGKMQINSISKLLKVVQKYDSGVTVTEESRCEMVRARLVECCSKIGMLPEDQIHLILKTALSFSEYSRHDKLISRHVNCMAAALTCLAASIHRIKISRSAIANAYNVCGGSTGKAEDILRSLIQPHSCPGKIKFCLSSFIVK